LTEKWRQKNEEWVPIANPLGYHANQCGCKRQPFPDEQSISSDEIARSDFFVSILLSDPPNSSHSGHRNTGPNREENTQARGIQVILSGKNRVFWLVCARPRLFMIVQMGRLDKLVMQSWFVGLL
jgi:hypothetical protein